MKFARRVEWQMTDRIGEYIELSRDDFDYIGPVVMCKGGASRAEQAAADSQRQQELGLMQQQLGLQMGQLNSVNSVLDPMIAAGGLAPGVEGALTSLVMNQLPQTFRNVQGQINQNLVARGVSGGQAGAGGGQIAGQFGQLGAMQAAMQQQGLSGIQLAKQNALMNELGTKMGIGAQFGSNVGGFNQGSLGALNAGVTAANNVDQAQTSWMGPVFGALGSFAGGGAFGKGGIFGGGQGQGQGGCWIAFAVYGEDDLRAYFIRHRLWTRADRDAKFRRLMGLYMLIGKEIAWLIQKIPLLKMPFRMLFETFMEKEIPR